MKLLISLLSMFSILIFSTTQIVSCTIGIKDDDSDQYPNPNEDNENYDQLLKEMHIKINDLIQTVFKNNTQKLLTTPETIDSKYKFLSIANIKNTLNEQDNVIVDLDDPALIDKKDDLLYDLDLMYSNVNINNLIVEFADENEEYGIFLKYVDNYFRTFVIDEGLVEFQKGIIKWNNKIYEPYYQVKFTVRVEYVFNNLNHDLDSYETQNYHIVFSYFESQEGFEALFNILLETLPKNLFNNDVFKFDKNILKNEKDYSDISQEIEEFLLFDDSFHNEFKNEIEKIIYEEMDLDLNISLDNLDVDSVTVTEDYIDPSGKINQYITPNLNSSKFINEFVFNSSQLSNFEKVKLLEKESKNIFDDNWFSDLLNSLLENYGKDLTNDEEIEKWLRVIKFGQISLSGIEIDFQQAEEFMLPTLFFDYTYETLGEGIQDRVYLYEETVVEVLSNFQEILDVSRNQSNSNFFDMKVYKNLNGDDMFVDNFKDSNGIMESPTSGLTNGSIFNFNENDEVIKAMLEDTEINNLSLEIDYSPYSNNSVRINENGIYIKELNFPNEFKFIFKINNIRISVINDYAYPSNEIPYFSFKKNK